MSTSPVRHAARELRHHLLRNVMLSLLAVMLFVTTGALAVYRDFQNQLTTVNIDDILGTDRPEEGDGSSTEDLNILVMGSDSRDGQVVDDGTEGMRSDTAMIVHLSADRSRMDVVSIPRDTMVEMPACKLPDGTESEPSSYAIFNSAFSTGANNSTNHDDVRYAAACTVKTVEKLTNIPLDKFIVVDFTGFEKMVDTLGGVPMYIEEDVDDDKADLHLSKGCHTLNGAEALGYARARYSLGDGSDLSRIGRQQQLVAAIMRTAMSKNLLTDTPTLYGFAGSMLSTLTTDLDATGLAKIGNSAASIGMDNINFITMPHEPDPYDPNRVAPSKQADAVWTALRDDKPVPEESVSLSADGTSPNQGATPTDASSKTTGSEEPTAPATTPDAGSPSAEPSTAPTVDPALQCR